MDLPLPLGPMRPTNFPLCHLKIHAAEDLAAAGGVMYLVCGNHSGTLQLKLIAPDADHPQEQGRSQEGRQNADGKLPPAA